MLISKRINNIEFSGTMQIAAKAIELKSRGEDVINLTVGEPDFPTPQRIKDAAIKALENNHTKYTLNNGISELRSAISDRLKNDYSLDYSLDEIIVSNGAKHSIYNAIQTIINEGDEVLIQSPYYVSYPQMVKLAGGIPRILKTSADSEFKFTADQLSGSITHKTKAIILCNPSNPTGTVYQKNELEKISKIILENDLLVISDEIYSQLIYDKIKYVSFASLSDEIKKRTILINGVSKAYSMTGWRIGYAAAEKEIIDGMSKLQSHSTSCAGSISQYASLEALSGPQYDVEEMRALFEERRNFVYGAINSMTGVSAVKPEGAFYIFPDVSQFLNKKFKGNEIKNSFDLSIYLIEEAKVVTVPGSVFGAEGFLRIAYAASLENLEVGMNRIKEALTQLNTA